MNTGTILPFRRRLRLAIPFATALGLAATSLVGLGTAGGSPVQRAVSASRCSENRAAGTLTFVSPYGYDASAGIIDVYAAAALGYFKALCLTVVTEATPPSAPASYTLVSAGKGTVTGLGSAADTLLAMANGSNLTAIATYGDTSDYALVTEPSTHALPSLAGKTLGYKVTMPVVLTEMLQHAKVDLAKVHEVAVTTYDPAILAQGKVQALQVYQSNEPFTLAAEHLAFREWTPAQFGVAGTFNTVVVNRDFYKAHPGATRDFLRAELHGFTYCAVNPNACIAIEAKLQGKGYDVAHSLAEWKKEAALAADNTLAGNGVGVQSLAEWRPEAQAIQSQGVAKKLPNLSSVVDTTMAASLYTGKQLLWPGN